MHFLQVHLFGAVHLHLVYFVHLQLVPLYDKIKKKEEGEIVPFRYKIDVIKTLKEKGYTSYKIRNEKIFGQKTLQDFRNNNVVFSEQCFDKLCSMLKLQIGDIVEWIPEGTYKDDDEIESEVQTKPKREHPFLPKYVHTN